MKQCLLAGLGFGTITLMGRRKKRFGLTISNNTTFTVIGIILAISSFVLLVSFFYYFTGESNSGKILGAINAMLIRSFGGVAFGIPFFVALLAGHCFRTKKFTLIHWHTSIGTFFFLTGSAALFATGSFGAGLQNTVFTGFTPFAGRLILMSTIFIGIVLFFDIEPQSILLFIRNLFKKIFQTLFQSKAKSKSSPSIGEFIKDRKDPPQPAKLKHDTYVSDQGNKSVLPAISTQQSQTHTSTLQKDMMLTNTISNSQKMMWVHPSLDLLTDAESPADRGDMEANAATIEETLKSFGIKARVAEINPGPTVTQYALEVAIGTNISEIVKKSSNLALTLASSTGTVRIEAPIPGRSLVGIEIPNHKPELVTIKRLLKSNLFINDHDPLLVPLGLDVAGEAKAVSIAKLPHVLIAGTTGSGKSVAINAWITTILFRAKPSEVRLVLVDPKQVELTGYNGVPHLMTEVITDSSKVVNALRWAVAEMEARYKTLSEAGVRNIQSYNNLPNVDKKPYIVFVIDELADLMMVAKADIESLIVRIAQKARAVGIHLVLSTQRPSVNVITGLMKANIPARLAFNVASGVDSKVILDTVGAENLVGKGDMFYNAPDTPRPKRIQGPFVSDKEINTIVRFIKEKNPSVEYSAEITETKDGVPSMAITGGNFSDRDPLFADALQLIRGQKSASASLFQRHLKVGFSRAARILDELHAGGFVGPANGSKPREVILTEETVV
jgi:DNA segregation ATPase FtsK/SpoIIIE, S-DNA-T family